MVDGHDVRAVPLRSLGEVSGEVVRAMREHPFWKDVAAKEHAHPAQARGARANLERNAPVPTEAQARTLLDAAFFASMLDEEGRRTVFTLAFLPPEAVPESHDLTAFAFAKPVALSPKNLAKLAPSAAPDMTYLGVAPNRRGELEIWGLVHRGDRTFGIDLNLHPLCFLLQVHRAGTLSARYVSNVFFVYSKGEIHFIDATADLLGQLRDRFALKPVVAQVLCRLALRVLEHGHGGAILVVGRGCVPARVSFHSSYQPREAPSDLLRAAVEEYEADLPSSPAAAHGSQAMHPLHRRERRYADALAFTAQLTAVDGATVLDDALEILGFGAIVQTSEAAEAIVVQVEEVYTGAKSTSSVAEHAGTRHRSAIQFCASQPEGSLALALVASQDGQLSVFAKGREKDTVIALRSFELGIGI